MSLWTAMMVLDLVMSGDQIIGTILDAADASRLLEQERLQGELDRIAKRMNLANIDYEQYMSKTGDARSKMTDALSKMAPIGGAYNKVRESRDDIKNQQQKATNDFAQLSKDLYNTQVNKANELQRTQTEQMVKEGRGAIYRGIDAIINRKK